MTESKRNIAVGLTLLVALAGLAFMILLFGETPTFLRRGYPLHIYFPTSGGIGEGADIHLNGIPIGRVTEVRLRDDPRLGVAFTCLIRREHRIPGDVNAYIYTRGVMGGAYVELASDGRSPGIDRDLDWLPEGYTIEQGQDRGAGLIPDEVLEQVDAIVASFQSFGELAENLNRLIAPDEPGEPGEPGVEPNGDAEARADLRATLSRLNRTLDGFNAIIGDRQSQQNLRETLENLRIGTEEGVAVMGELREFISQARESLGGVDESIAAIGDAARVAQQRGDQVAGSLVEQADNLGLLLTTLNEAANQMTEGDGTMGRMLNDPRLYNNLVEATSELIQTLNELQRTIELWQQQGVPIRMGR